MDFDFKPLFYMAYFLVALALVVGVVIGALIL